MNVMLRTVDKAADAPRQAELISETLARFAHDLRAEAIPAEVRERAKHLDPRRDRHRAGLGPLRLRPQSGHRHLGARRRGHLCPSSACRCGCRRAMQRSSTASSCTASTSTTPTPAA